MNKKIVLIFMGFITLVFSCNKHLQLKQSNKEKSEKLFIIKQNGKLGYIDKTGKYIWKPTE